MANSVTSFKSAFINLLHIIVNFVLDNLLGWYWGAPQRIDGPAKDTQKSIVTKSAVELAQLIRQRTHTVFEIVKAYSDRIEETKIKLNAVVEGPFKEALEEARVLDERISSGDISEEEWSKKPFLGVPFTTKDSTEVKGRLHTLGLKSRRNVRSTADAECVRIIREAGGIILATSNVPEVNKWMETRNLVLGQTNNPYDLRRTVGGSSGGEGALISACCTGFGLGTDIGGSIRIPAFYCGIFGHKPTNSLVNTRGCTFRTGKELKTMVVAGPMARTSEDLIAIFKVLIGEAQWKSLRLNEKVNYSAIKYYYIDENGMKICNPINAETQQIMFKVRQHFENLSGQKVKKMKLPHLELTGKMWRYWMTQEPADLNLLLGNGVKLNPYIELLKKLLGCSDFTLAAIYSLIDGILPKERESLILKATTECKKVLNEILGDDGVLFFHSSPRTAPFHYYPLLRYPDFHYFSIFNVLKVPVTQVPMGLDFNGLPLGIQVVSTEKNDRLCLAVAQELERTFGGWVAPF